MAKKRLGVKLDAAAKVRGLEGYPEAATPPLTEAEAAMLAQRTALIAAECAGRKPLGAPNFKQPAGSDRLRVSGLTYSEAKAWFETGELP